MGSVLIIKNADFSENALGVVDIEGLTPSWMGKEFCLPRVASGINTANTKRILYARDTRATIVINSSDASDIYHFATTGSNVNPIPNQNDYSYPTVPSMAEQVNVNITNTDYLMFVEANYQNETYVVSGSDWARSVTLNVAEANTSTLFLSITIKRSNEGTVPSNLTLSDLGLTISFT